MGSSPRSEFRKTWHCPTSQDLASFHLLKDAHPQDSHLASHLATCDFCAAELQLLSKFPLADYSGECPPMPASLQALAQALFGAKGVGRQAL
jgi:hypothetical protein